MGNSSLAVNNGLITLNSMSNDLDEDGNLLTETGLHLTAQDYRRGTAMLANSAGARAVNAVGGEIRVHNAGMGMVANDGTALNQGTITLTVDNENTDGLYAMAAVGSGIAINDTTGVININTDLGQAFYTEGNGQVFNFGTVNFYGSPINNGDPNWGASTSESDYAVITTPVLTAEGKPVAGAVRPGPGFLFRIPPIMAMPPLMVRWNYSSSNIWLHNLATCRPPPYCGKPEQRRYSGGGRPAFHLRMAAQRW
ncbi:hypothetical protein ABC733_26255 [Mangrovibacter sp. SLW1]